MTCEREVSITKPIRLIELFGGYGSQAMALERLGVDFERYKLIENDKYAIKSYNAIHNTDFCPIDMQQVYSDDLRIKDTDKYIYIMTYTYPCQDLSVAGKKRGMSKGSGTRSGLLWEVERVLKEIKGKGGELPQILFMENVKSVLSNNNLKDFNLWIGFLENLGYTNTYSVLNAKDFGVPQNRERCFMISILGGYSYKFPSKTNDNCRISDILEANVDDKYYIKTEKAKNLLSRILNSGKDINLRTSKIEKYGNIYNDKFTGMSYGGNVYNKNGISPMLSTGQGGGRQPMIIDEKGIRKLTPKECGRLMGVKDSDIDKMLSVNSNTQCYKQFGNSIVVNCMVEIFKNLNIKNT